MARGTRRMAGSDGGTEMMVKTAIDRSLRRKTPGAATLSPKGASRRQWRLELPDTNAAGRAPAPITFLRDSEV